MVEWTRKEEKKISGVTCFYYCSQNENRKLVSISMNKDLSKKMDVDGSAETNWSMNLPKRKKIELIKYLIEYLMTSANNDVFKYASLFAVVIFYNFSCSH